MWPRSSFWCGIVQNQPIGRLPAPSPFPSRWTTHCLLADHRFEKKVHLQRNAFCHSFGDPNPKHVILKSYPWVRGSNGQKMAPKNGQNWLKKLPWGCKSPPKWPVFYFLFSSLFLSDRSKWDFWGGQKRHLPGTFSSTALYVRYFSKTNSLPGTMLKPKGRFYIFNIIDLLLLNSNQAFFFG